MAASPGTILYLSEFFLPASTAAGLRAGRWVSALQQGGYDGAVVTTGSEAVVSAETENGAWPVYRVTTTGQLPPALDLGNTAAWQGALPGPAAGGPAIAAMYRLAQYVIERYRPRVIFATGPHFGVLTIARHLAAKYNLPWIMELRDAWFTAMPWPYAHRSQRRLAQEEEAACLRQAARVITITETLTRKLVEAHGPGVAEKITTIRHGFAPFEAVENDAVGVYQKSPDEFTLAYVGQLRGIDIAAMSSGRRLLQGAAHALGRAFLGAQYCEQLRLDYMSPHYLMQALSIVLQNQPDLRRRVKLIFAGERFKEVDRLARRYHLTDHVRQLGPLPPEQARRLMQQANLLVINLYGITGCDYHWCIPSKLYDYLGSGTPILGLLPRGEAADIITRSRSGWIAAPDDVEAIVRRLSDIINNAQAVCSSFRPDVDIINSFRLEQQQAKLLDVLESVLVIQR